jgi:hypothetical protein
LPPSPSGRRAGDEGPRVVEAVSTAFSRFIAGGAPARRAALAARAGERRRAGGGRPAPALRRLAEPSPAAPARPAACAGREPTGPAAGACAVRSRRVLPFASTVVSGQVWSGSRTRDRPNGPGPRGCSTQLSYPVVCGPGIEPGWTPQSPQGDRSYCGGMRGDDRPGSGCRAPAGLGAPARGPLQRGCGRFPQCEWRASGGALPRFLRKRLNRNGFASGEGFRPPTQNHERLELALVI